MQCRSSRWFLSHACYFSFGVIASYIEKCVGNVFPSFKSFLHSDNRQENRRERCGINLCVVTALSPLLFQIFSSSTTNLQNSREKFLSIRQPHTGKSTVTAFVLTKLYFLRWFACLLAFILLLLLCFQCAFRIPFQTCFLKDIINILKWKKWLFFGSFVSLRSMYGRHFV